MSWEPKNRRWWKTYRGKRYVVSCRQLDAPATKEGSYQAAIAWWTTKKAEIDLVHQAPYHPQGSRIVIAERQREWGEEKWAR